MPCRQRSHCWRARARAAALLAAAVPLLGFSRMQYACFHSGLALPLGSRLKNRPPCAARHATPAIVSDSAAGQAAVKCQDPNVRRFDVGTRVRCRMSWTEWTVGTVTRSNYGSPHEVAPYQVQLDDGTLFWVPEDDDQIIQGASFWDSPLGNLRKQFVLASAPPWQGGQSQLPATGADAAKVAPHQLARDIEQFEHLVSKGVLGADLQEYVTASVLPDYRRTLEAAEEALVGSLDSAATLERRPEFESVFSLREKALYLHPGDAVRGDAIGARDFDAVEREFQSKEHHAVVMDDFFSPEALSAIRDFLMDSTFWFDTKSGYAGTYSHTGFASPLVAQIDQELRTKLPNVIGSLELQNCWAFMFDGSMGGVRTHADNAQVQINFFLTPTEANEWSEDETLPGGGLIVYGVGPPEDMTLLEANLENDEAKEHIIAATGHWNITVPYVQNRAILFDSTYFHRTDDMKFKKGYKNRRINMTFLYGRRADLKPAATISR